MKAFFTSVFWIALALGVAFWGLFVVDTTSYARMGNIHDIAEYRIEVEGNRDEIFEKVSGLKIKRVKTQPNQDDDANDANDAEEEEASDLRPSFEGETMLELPGLKEFGSASLLLVEHRLPDFLMYQERYRKIIFIHGVGFEQVRPDVTEISWQIQSPNTQWWFHGFIMHPSSYFWKQQITQVLNNVKKTLESAKS